MSVTLCTAEGTEMVCSASEKDLQTAGNYEKAVVNEGSWIFYRKKNFNNSIASAGADDIKHVKKGETVYITSHNGSMYLLPGSDQRALVLFQKPYYGGVDPDPQVYENCNTDITAQFPPGTGKGVSSAIVCGAREWKLCSETQYGGILLKLNAGSWYEKLPTDLDNEVKGVKKYDEVKGVKSVKKIK